MTRSCLSHCACRTAGVTAPAGRLYLALEFRHDRITGLGECWPVLWLLGFRAFLGLCLRLFGGRLGKLVILVNEKRNHIIISCLGCA